MNVVLTVASYLYLYSLGKAIIGIYKKGKYSKISISGIPVNYFYVIVSLFLIGNISLLLNYILRIKFFTIK